MERIQDAGSPSYQSTHRQLSHVLRQCHPRLCACCANFLTISDACLGVTAQAVNHPYLVVHSATSAASAPQLGDAAAPASAICAVCHDPFEVPHIC